MTVGLEHGCLRPKEQPVATSWRRGRHADVVLCAGGVPDQERLDLGSTSRFAGTDGGVIVTLPAACGAPLSATDMVTTMAALFQDM